MNSRVTLAPGARTVRVIDVQAHSPALDALGRLYADEVDVLLVRAAAPSLTQAAARLQARAGDDGWARPNVVMPPEDIHLLGTDTPATPTFRDPRGASLEAYLDSAARLGAQAQSAIGDAVDLAQLVPEALAHWAGGRAVELARASDGRAYAACTIRRLTAGCQIGLHHDRHYGLPLYADLAPRVDTSTLVSFVFTLQSPEAGGDLLVYAATSDMPDLPRQPNGFAFDLAAVEARYHRARISPQAGDLFILAAGRCLHRVELVAGPAARITLGGFMALDRARERVLYWS